jgi:hypothetical protein
LQLSSGTGAPTIQGTNISSGAGVYGAANAPLASGVFGANPTGFGVRGDTGTGTAGVWGNNTAGGYGVLGTATVSGWAAVRGETNATNGFGVSGLAPGAGGTGVWGSSTSVTGFGVYGSNSGGGFAGYFNGKVQVNDTLTVLGSGDSAGVFQSGGEVVQASGGLTGFYGRGSDVGVSGLGGKIGVLGIGDNYGIKGVSAGWAGYFDGKVGIAVLGTGGATSLCRNNATFEIAPCSSSLRYKTHVQPFAGGLDIVNKLRPIAFTWKQDGMRDIGLGAEDVARVEPLLTFRNDHGEIEGVKYSQLSAVFVNAFVEQQTQIRRQQREITRQHQKITRQQQEITQQQKSLAAQQRDLAALKNLVCRSQPDAQVCR